METFIFLILAIAYFTGAYYLTRLVRRILPHVNKYLRIPVLSLVYALLFGLGILGSGGDPGFAFPFPIIWTALIYVWEWSKWVLFINGVIIPLIFWWVLFFIFLTTSHYAKLISANRIRKSN